MKGRGQGTSLATPEKPLPLPGVSRVFFLYFLSTDTLNTRDVSRQQGKEWLYVIVLPKHERRTIGTNEINNEEEKEGTRTVVSKGKNG